MGGRGTDEELRLRHHARPGEHERLAQLRLGARRRSVAGTGSDDGHGLVAERARGDDLTAQWRARLLGIDPTLRNYQAIWRRVPAAPRCKVCAAPFKGLGGRITGLVRHGRSRGNPLLCSACFAA
jgi:hypothetical protein